LTRSIVAAMAVHTLSRRSHVATRAGAAIRSSRHAVAHAGAPVTALELDLLLLRERPETMDPEEVRELRARLNLLGR
jgi:hypothetical protein